MKCKESDLWATPLETFKWINDNYGPFDLDACATPQNAKLPVFFTEEQDGLAQDWSKTARTVYVNPPYSNPNPWIEKAHLEASRGVRTVLLLKADHSTKIYAKIIYDWDKREYYPGVERVDLRKRIKFVPPVGLINKKTGKPVKAGSPNYPSMLIIFHPK